MSDQFEPSDPPAEIPEPSFGKASGAVITAMLKVKMAVNAIPKRGTNTHDKYNYVKADDLWGILQQEEAKAGLMIMQRLVNWQITNKVLAATYTFDVYHESGEVIYNIASHVGAARFQFNNNSVDDKSFSKAMTSCAKYVHLFLYKIPTDEAIEPLSDGDADAQGQNQDFRDRNASADRPQSRGNGAANGNGRDGDYIPRDEIPPPRGPEDYGTRSPDDGPPLNRDRDGLSRPPADPEQAELQRRVYQFRDDVLNARTEEQAAEIWMRQQELLQSIPDNTYADLCQRYKTRWDIQPPHPV